MICVIEKSTNIVIDVNQQYDTRFFDHVEVPDGTIPDGANPAKYFRDGAGNIVRRDATELEAEYRDEFLVRALAIIDAAASLADIKAILRRMAIFILSK